MKRVVVLGSTGSIGLSALRVAESLPDRLQVVGLSVQRNFRPLLQQAARLGVRHVAVSDPEQARDCAREAPAGTSVYAGVEGLETLARLPEADLVLCAVVGMAGLRPVLAALGAGKDVALATKEVLVAAGRIVTDAARSRGVRLLPVDSEHSAVFQCLQGREGHGAEVRRLILTASGGPFGLLPDVDLERVTVEEALAHPRWNMGKKVSIDSATMMNKGLEIMEACWLFGLPATSVDVVIHPESIVHSLVEFVDGSLLAQLGVPDMRLPIQYALTFPERVDGQLPALDVARLGTLRFQAPDERRFPCLALAREAARVGGTLPAVLNAANEVAVEKFLVRRIPFAGIWRLVEAVMARHTVCESPGLDELVAADAWGRRMAREQAQAG